MRSQLIAVLGTIALTLGLLTGCEAGSDDPPAPTGKTAPASPVERKTLASLAEVDEHPLWTMRYEGSYDRLRDVSPKPTGKPWGCSLFFAGGDPQRPLFARNFDWDENPALLLFTDPPDGHASVSMVDVSYLGIHSAKDFTTTKGKRALLDAPLLPFDGMNDQGLAVGLAAVPDAEGPADAGLPKVGSLRVLRLILDKAATVEEAIQIFKTVRIDFEGGPPLHYLIADAQGGSAVVEFVDGKVVAERGAGSWNAAVNFTLAGTGAAERQDDERYRIAGGELRQQEGKLGTEQALGLLRQVAQSHTRWSVVYGLKSGEVTLVTGQRWDVRHTYELAMD